MRLAAPGRVPCAAGAARVGLQRRVPAAPLRRCRCAPTSELLVEVDDAESPPLDTVGVLAAWATAPPPPPLLCAADARALLAARAARAASASVSLDLGRSGDVSASLSEQGALLAPRLLLPWPAVEAAAEDVNGTQQLIVPADGSTEAEASLARISTFSDSTSRPVALFAAPSGRGPPSALVAGFSMHRFGKGVDPGIDTARKLAAIAPLRAGARVLDICTGLGYTSCAAAQRGAEVTTVELDDAMQAMCSANPWSRISAPVVPLPVGRGSAAMQAALAPGTITQLRGDASLVVAALAAEIAAGTRPRFDRILTDPPSFALAGMLYSTAFYADMRACLAAKGKLYHYIGDPESAHGARVAKGVVKRLRDVGFEGVAVDTYAHGVVAANEFVRATRPRAEAPGRRAPAGATADKRGYGMRGRVDAGGRAGQRVRGAAAARLARSFDDEDDDEDESDE